MWAVLSCIWSSVGIGPRKKLNNKYFQAFSSLTFEIAQYSYQRSNKDSQLRGYCDVSNNGFPELLTIHPYCVQCVTESFFNTWSWDVVASWWPYSIPALSYSPVTVHVLTFVLCLLTPAPEAFLVINQIMVLSFTRINVVSCCKLQ